MNNLSGNKKLSKNQLSNMIQLGGCLSFSIKIFFENSVTSTKKSKEKITEKQDTKIFVFDVVDWHKKICYGME